MVTNNDTPDKTFAITAPADSPYTLETASWCVKSPAKSVPTERD